MEVELNLKGKGRKEVGMGKDMEEKFEEEREVLDEVDEEMGEKI